jgi:hypothetical protein
VPKSGQKAKADLESKSGFAFSSLLDRFSGGFFLYVAGVMVFLEQENHKPSHVDTIVTSKEIVICGVPC